MAYSLDDTIAAISTPVGVGGIGIVRLSGPQALEIVRSLFRRACGQRRRWETQRLYYGHVVNPADGRLVDEALVSWMAAPHSFTRQDVAELNVHGGPVPLREVLALCLAQGARLAEPGEFTLRAFVNGRIDLAQAEAVLDTIQSKSAAALRVAVNQLNGRLSGQVRALREELLEVLAYLQASIDFAEDDIPPRDVRPALGYVQDALRRLIGEADAGQVYRQGVRTAIIGRPNVGKSSLLNALLRTDRAIVTSVPGTTRDTLEETLILRGVPFVLVDTAGINESQDVVERIGVERSRRSVSDAGLVLLVVDGSEPCGPQDIEVARLVGDRAAILVVNKVDLPQAGTYDRLLESAERIEVSALTGQGIAELEAMMECLALGGAVQAADDPLTSNPRHRAAFARALDHVTLALEAAQAGWFGDLVAIDVGEAVFILGEITGETASEDLLATIFGQFCIGK